jgi:hypothetical protein
MKVAFPFFVRNLMCVEVLEQHVELERILAAAGMPSPLTAYNISRH